MSEITNADEARAALEQARTEYRELVLGLSEDEWSRQSNNAGWNNGQLCWHIAFGVGAGGQSLSRLRKNKGMNPPAPLMAVINFASLWYVRIRSRGATAESVLALFDEGCAKMQHLADGIGDDEWGNGGVVLGQETTVGGVFAFPSEHIGEHGAEMRRD
ncbi:MAG: DinB family protein [Chloroflexi bacterium]|nr:DinB family protein [Chloroflexota bacterium]MCY3589659.1 DinB family protein [Chloroflexota bacterium]MCY3687139.1 DinB family protein [Chloroflexota bacterium]MDE2709956.1 DinB family protein [Chloroflexota bacterium]